MRPINTRARATPLPLAGRVTVPLALAAYEADRGQCVAVAMQAQAEYERQQRLKRESNMTIGLIVGAIADAAVGGNLSALKGGLSETDYDPVTSPRKIVDRCIKNRGYKILRDLGKWA